MPITKNDILFKGSGGSDSSDQSKWLGGGVSNHSIVSGELHNVFPEVIGEESEKGNVKYRCIYVKNNHSSLTLKRTKLWIHKNTTSPDDDVEVAKSVQGMGVALGIPDESTAPVGVTFSKPTNKSIGLDLGDITPGSEYGIWIKRIVNKGASAINANEFILKVEGDTSA